MLCFRVNQWITKERRSVEVVESSTGSERVVDINQYHLPFHESINAMKLRAKKEGVKLTGVFHPCEACNLGRLKKKGIKKVSLYDRATSLFGRVYADLSGPLKWKSIDGARYLMVFVDDFSRKKWVYLLRDKSMDSVEFAIRKFINEEVLPTGIELKVFRSDNGLEFVNRKVIETLFANNVMREYTEAYTPKQNSVAESAIRDIKSLAIVLLNGGNLRHNHMWLWGESVRYATTLMNSSSCRGNPRFDSPNRMLGIADKPLYFQFGSKAMFKVGSSSLQELFGNSGRLGLFVGFVVGPTKPKDLAKFYDLETRKIIETSTFRIHDGVMIARKGEFIFTDELCSEDRNASSELEEEGGESLAAYTDLSLADMEDDGLGLSNLYSCGDATVEQEGLEEETASVEELEEDTASGDAVLEVLEEEAASGDVAPVLDREGSILDRMPHERYRDSTLEYNSKYFCPKVGMGATNERILRNGKVIELLDVFVTTGVSPNTFKQATASLEHDSWKKAMQQEMVSLVKHNTWDLIEPPKDASIVGCRWVYAKKFHPDGSIRRYKARLVVQGFSQTEGIDYFETFAPVVSITTIRMMLALAAVNQWKLDQMDVETAFLNSTVEEDIYVRQAPGFIVEGKEGLVYKLKRSLYGLKQAPRNWNNCLTDFLLEIGLVQSEVDPCLFFLYIYRKTKMKSY